MTTELGQVFCIQYLASQLEHSQFYIGVCFELQI